MVSSESHADTNTHTTDAHHESHSGGKKHSLASMLKPPAVKKHDKVLAETAEQVAAEGHPRLSSELNSRDLTEHEKAKLLVEERDANAPTGHFVLGNHKPAMVSQGYGEYYGAKAATQNRT